MGMDRTIRFPSGGIPSWDAIRDQLLRVGVAAPLRMIDGMPAFPDETPEPTWRELRVGTPAGMVTLRRGADSLSCVVWGNADAALTAAWDGVCWACAEAGHGTIDTPAGPVSAAEFAAATGLSPS
jgi:hypothetical protein